MCMLVSSINDVLHNATRCHEHASLLECAYMSANDFWNASDYLVAFASSHLLFVQTLLLSIVFHVVSLLLFQF